MLAKQDIKKSLLMVWYSYRGVAIAKVPGRPDPYLVKQENGLEWSFISLEEACAFLDCQFALAGLIGGGLADLRITQ